MMTYLNNIRDSLRTTVKGMQVTFKNMLRPETTVEYPEQLMPMPVGYRGIHTLDQDICIYCFQCSKICPVDCIEMAADRVEKKFLSWETFKVDYNKCLFCDLCIEVCPKDCIHMDKRDGSAKFALVTDDRTTLNLSLLSYDGLSEPDKATVKTLREGGGAEAAAAPAKKAAMPPTPGAPPVPGKKPAVPPTPGAKAPAVPPTPGKAAVPPTPGKAVPPTPGKPATPPTPGAKAAPKSPPKTPPKAPPKSPNVPPTPNTPNIPPKP